MCPTLASNIAQLFSHCQVLLHVVQGLQIYVVQSCDNRWHAEITRFYQDSLYVSVKCNFKVLEQY
jgi:hypothetical protein